MAQTVPHSMANSAPFPPGLGVANGNGSAKPVEGAASAASQAACEDGVVGRRAWLDERSEKQAIMDDVRRVVLEDIDAKVAEKMKDLWSKGNKMLKQVEQENQKQNAKLLEEIALCHVKQDGLKAEHEHLKTVLSGMVQHFNMLGVMFGSSQTSKAIPPMPASVVAGLAANGIHGSPPPSTTDAPTNSSAASSSTIQDSPSSFAGGAYPPLPTVPDFPFPPGPTTSTPLTSVATPLLLAEALGSESPSPSVPVSLVGSLPPPCTGHVFSFTLRKADGTDLGLNVSHHENDKALRVEGVRPEGAVEAWNRQCIGSTASEKAVIPGDRIVSVNGVINDPVKMLEECRDRQLLKLTVIRGEVQAPPQPKTVALRADASEFVPGTAAPGLEVISEVDHAATSEDDADAAITPKASAQNASTDKPSDA